MIGIAVLWLLMVAACFLAAYFERKDKMRSISFAAVGLVLLAFFAILASPL